MTISPINNYVNYAALSQANWFDRYGFSVRQSANSNLPPVEPIAAIDRTIYDVNDIDYKKIGEYEKKVFGNDKQDIKENASKNDVENTKKNNFNEDTKLNGEALTEDEKALVDKLKVTDAKVKAHEQAHLSVAGDLATSGASYTYQQGPDGKQYAVGGEVNIDTSSEDSPEKTIAKMERVIAAAMAPAEPSGQDHSVVASARQRIADMKNQIMQQNNEDNNKTEESKNATTNSINKNDNSKVDISINSSTQKDNNTSTTNDVNNIRNAANSNENINNINGINSINIANNKLDVYQKIGSLQTTSKGLYINSVA